MEDNLRAYLAAVTIQAVVIIALLIIIFVFIMREWTLSQSTFESRNAFVSQCLVTDRYTLDQCVLMAGE